ncbi:hypothetical protein CVT25_015012 [Psilocybe cyanescens]|uniref:Uncharacterized protein n=1 Tax=Psilocybe cyanescens TaxID=93625 RepID=A0A409XAG4_PSICY|nr:hypothetical protein CVT25_015012 [Psilocybe cyanescens]
MSNTSIFANSEALIGGMLHLNDLIKKGAENGNILDVIQRQKIGVRNVLQAQKSGAFTDTIEAHEHLFFWAPVLDYYCQRNKADFDAAKFSAKYKMLHEEQSGAGSGSVERSGAAVSEERETGQAGAVPTGVREENRKKSTVGGKWRNDGRPTQVGARVSAETNNPNEGASLGYNPAPVPVPVPSTARGTLPAPSLAVPTPSPAPVLFLVVSTSSPALDPDPTQVCPRPPPRVMQVNQNPRVPPKSKTAGPGPEEATGSKPRSKPKAAPRSKS